MDAKREAGPRREQMPRFDDSSFVQRAVIAREDGMRRLRRMSNWTAAVLIAGVAATSGYFAHTTLPAPAARVITTTVHTCPGPSIGTSQRPTLSNAVATSGGSGVTVGASGSAVAAGASGSGVTCGTLGSTGGGGGTASPWRDD